MRLNNISAQAVSGSPTETRTKARTAERSGSTRREFNWLMLAWTAFTAATAAGLTATFRFMFPNVLFEPPTVFKAGFPESYKPGEVDERFKEKYGVWVVRNEDNLMYALIAICTHLGCPPNWLPQPLSSADRSR